jgi:hypothetical protein
MKEKQCNRCKEIKSIDDFHRDKYKADGREELTTVKYASQRKASKTGKKGS